MDENNSYEDLSDSEEKEIKSKTKYKKNKEIKEINEAQDNQVDNINLIKSISLTLTSIIKNSKKLENYKEIVKKQSKMVFSASSVPEISIEDYLIRIQTYSNVEKSTLILSLILIDRLCQKSNVTLTCYNIHRILFSAILASIKYNEDSYYDNKYYSEIAGVKLKELKSMEYYFISLIDFKLYVSIEDYNKYETYLGDFDKQ